MIAQQALRSGFGVLTLGMGVLLIAQELPDSATALVSTWLVPVLSGGGLLAGVLAMRFSLRVDPS